MELSQIPIAAASPLAAAGFGGAYYAAGNLELLTLPKLALFSSVRCPAELILKTHDLAQALRQSETAIISGFHSPMEEECLTVLLRGNAPLICCPARSLDKLYMPAVWRQLNQQGRLLLVSPFSSGHDRISSDLAVNRNRFVTALADAVLVTYANPGGRIEELCQTILSWGKPLYTLNSKRNDSLIAGGAVGIEPKDIATIVKEGWFWTRKK